MMSKLPSISYLCTIFLYNLFQLKLVINKGNKTENVYMGKTQLILRRNLSFICC